MLVTPDAAKRLIDARKIAYGWSGFQKRGNQAGHVIGVAQLADEHGVYFAGLTVEIETKAPVVSAQCLMQFSLRQKTGKVREIVYQLEVTPADKRSHNGRSPIYGPHEHVGDSEPTAINETGVNCSDWDSCLKWFANRANISNLEVGKPC